MSAVDKWGKPNTPKRELLAHAMVVEMKNRGGCRVGDMESKQREIEAAPAHSVDMLSQLIRTW